MTVSFTPVRHAVAYRGEQLLNFFKIGVYLLIFFSHIMFNLSANYTYPGLR